METKFTSGPWRIETLNGKWPIVREVPNPDGEAPSFIATVSCTRKGYGAIMARIDFGYGYKPEEMEANAALIASAPALLAERDELREALKRMTEIAAALVCNPGAPKSERERLASEFSAAMNQSRAILAKGGAK